MKPDRRAFLLTVLLGLILAAGALVVRAAESEIVSEPNAAAPASDANQTVQPTIAEANQIPPAGEPPEPQSAAEPNEPSSTPQIPTEIDHGSSPADANEAMGPNEHIEPNEPNEPNVPSWQLPAGYWHIHHHPKVTPRIFLYLGYPYYPGGADYALTHENLEQLLARTESTSPSPPDASRNPQTPTPSEPNDRFEPNRTRESPAQPALPLGAARGVGPDQIRYALEQCLDLIHQWRAINESPATTLEVLRSLEMTKTSTWIFRVKPALAVKAKRTLGQIARLNRRFDCASRLMIQTALAGTFEKASLTRLEKQFADLQSLLEQLAEQNDLISTALGAGKIQRDPNGPARSELIDYSRLAPPADAAPLAP